MSVVRNDLQATAPEPELREYLLVLRRRKWAVLGIAAVTLAAALVVSFRQTPIYASTARVQVKPPTANQVLQSVAAASLVSMETEKELVRSHAVAEIAADDIPGRSATDELLEHLKVGAPTNTQILEITFSDPDPLTAQRGAQAFADAYLEFKAGQALEAYTRVRTSIQQQMAQVQQQLTAARERLAGAEPGSAEQRVAQTRVDLLTSQLALYRNQLGTLSVLEVDPGEVIQPAELPLEPASPNHLRNGLLALAVGLALGVGFAFLRERLDDQLRGREDLEQAVGAPALAVIPHVKEWKRRQDALLACLEAPQGPAAEAYRTVRTNLQFLGRDGGLRILTVTSPTSDEGKTATAANLAVVLAQAGKRVVALDCDLRKPRLARFFGLEREPGLTDVLAGEVALVQALQPVREVGPLLVLASGPIPGNPTELLDSEEMDRLLAEVRGAAAADFVILDTPPVLAVSDALTLVPRSDGVLVVADASTTTRTALREAREALEQVGGRIVGGVLNNLDAARARYYPGYYRYSYAYGYGLAAGDGRVRSPKHWPRRTRRP